MARIRSSAEPKKSAVAQAAKDIDIPHLWRQLRSAASQSKRPTGVCLTSGPIRPHLVNHLLIVASNVSENVSSEEEKPRGETETDSVLDVAVTASQIDTSTALSQNTLEHLFRLESDSDSSLSREHVVGAFQLLLSGAESNMGSADGAESGGDGEPCDDAIAVAADDVNLLSTGDLSDDYENVGSSGSEDSDSVDDDVVERRECPEEDVLLDENAALMDDEFIQSLGGTRTLYAMDKNTLRHF
ncbi:hypothetical protein PC128_g23343 [Phytophthora cactorum]|nr:hypothetical protein PC128_g23343 [Phytophthora cactorum]KAG4038772.1 hypothetical protein PC123_g25667 [Phytophthora cactorum]